MIVPFFVAVDFMNFTYSTNPCPLDVPAAVVMRSGHFEYQNEKMTQDFDLSVYSVNEGSLDDGTRQAVVVMECDFPIGGTAAAYLFDERPGGAVLIGRVGTADWGGDWGQGPSAIHIRFANHVLSASACANEDCTARSTTTYALRRGHLVDLKPKGDGSVTSR
jgi:hypothetical protein